MTANLTVEVTPSLSTSFAGVWLQVLSHTDPKYGGLSSTVPALAAATVGAGIDNGVAAFCNGGEQFMPPTLARDQISFWPYGRNALRDASLREELRHRIKECDGVHIHGLWEESTAVVASTARAEGVPYILSAHGMLEPWALRQKRLKKLIYSALVERKNVTRAACLHALTHAEAEQYVAFGARGPVAVIPNGIDVPQQLSDKIFLAEFPELENRRIVLFLARLHAKKGLDMLIEAWAEVSRIRPDAHLVIAGPDCDGNRLRLEKLVSTQGLDATVLFTGMLDSAMKWSALAAAEGFVLPSFSEGLSVGILEAMGAGVPVIVTHGCNMPEVQLNEAGWTIGATKREVASAVLELLGNTPVRNREMGRNGAEIVRKTYSWSTVGRQMADLYAWVQGGSRPTTFDLIQEARS